MEKTHQKLSRFWRIANLRLMLSIILISAFLPYGALAQISLISDEETEQYLSGIVRPLFKQAGIPFNRNNIYIVNDNSLNAFVSDGNNLFIHSGTLTRADNSDQVSGVLAHETGHIAGGHILRQKLKNQTIQEAGLASMILAGAAAAATGRSDVAMAVMMGTQGSLLSNYMAYRIEEERSADEAAIKLLNKEKISPQGLLEFMKKLQKQNILNGIEENRYFRTHPVTSERIHFLQQAAHQSPVLPSVAADDTFLRVKAKLNAFLSDPAQTFKRYPPRDNSVPARYARAIAYFKQLNFTKAQQTLDNLLKTEPDNPYFHELKAQILMEQGNFSAAKKEYARVLSLLPNAALIQIDWAKAALADTPSPAEVKEIIVVLNRSLQQRPSAIGWLLLSQAYSIDEQPAYADYAAAEHSLRIGEPQIAKRQATKALQSVPSARLKLKLEDLFQRIKNLYPDLENSRLK